MEDISSIIKWVMATETGVGSTVIFTNMAYCLAGFMRLYSWNLTNKNHMRLHTVLSIDGSVIIRWLRTTYMSKLPSLILVYFLEVQHKMDRFALGYVQLVWLKMDLQAQPSLFTLRDYHHFLTNTVFGGTVKNRFSHRAIWYWISWEEWEVSGAQSC